MKQEVRLSQCMIVKNEEKNIRQALSWGREMVCEQIVVDTGSTDRTVEIAESLGAKVYYFTWIDDFSAAKNFAIEKASGNWIAFLDADEYYNKEDTGKLIALLEKLEQEFEDKGISMDRNYLINSAWVQLDDNLKPFSTSVQERIFRNTGKICYKNRIHEQLSWTPADNIEMIDATRDLSIFHIGYSETSYKETGKSDRNIRLLIRELEENPENYNSWSYLGDAYAASGRAEEAKKAYRHVIEAAGKRDDIVTALVNSAFCTTMRLIYREDEKDGEEQLLALYKKLNDIGNNCPDAEYWLGLWMIDHGKPAQAVTYLQEGLKKLEHYEGVEALIMTGCLDNAYKALALGYYRLNQSADAVKYAVLTLQMDRYTDIAIEIILLLLKEEDGERSHAKGTIGFLQKLYNLGNTKDKFYLYKCALKTDFQALKDRIYEMMTAEEQKLLSR